MGAVGSGSAAAAATIGTAASVSATLGASSAGVSASCSGAFVGGVSAPAGISSTSQLWHQRQRIAASWISSAQYGQVFIERSFGSDGESLRRGVGPARTQTINRP